jgi:hypothetical protein
MYLAYRLRYIYVKPAESTGLPWPQRSRNEQNEFKYARFGWVMGSGSGETMSKYYAHTFGTTDAAGHFAFQGV